jgi:hypothetical protein
MKSKWLTEDGHQVMAKAHNYCLWQGLLKRILKCEYLLVMYRINMLHYISMLISKGDNGKSYLSFNRGEDFF